MRKIRERWLYGPRADWLAVPILLGASLLWAGLTWGQLYDPIVDQGWYMQVAARVDGGDLLYRDMIWMYGPLPVYLLALLFRWLGTHVSTFFLLYYTLAGLGCLLTYRVARFLLDPPLALLGTLALFLGGWWGGFVGYTQAYTGAVPLGAVLGLLFVVCLLSYLQGGKFLWLAGAGLASGAALLTKPEFGLASTGTGLLVLTGQLLLPGVSPGSGRNGLRALGVFVISTAAVAGIGFGILGYRAGWANVWVGVTGYDQDAILLQVWPPWGTLEAWLYIASGLGIHLLLGVSLAGVVAPAAAKRHLPTLGLLAGLGLMLAVLPWYKLSRMKPELVPSILASRELLIEEGLRVFWAPGTVLLTALIVVLGILWVKAHRQRKPVSPALACLAVLALYSALADVRSFLHPTGTFHFMYLDTLLPLLLFTAVALIPRIVERQWQTPVALSRARNLVALGLLGYAVAGLVWDADYYSRLDTPWRTPRGDIVFRSSFERRRAWPELLQYILAHTELDDPIAVLGQEPGYYFWTGRRNPLRQDTLLPGMESSPEDALEIVRRFEEQPPRLIAIPQGVTYGRGWFWELEVGRQAYKDLAPVWDYILAHYRFHRILGGETWGYAVYELQGRSP